MLNTHHDFSEAATPAGGDRVDERPEDTAIAVLDTLSEGIAAVVDKIGPAVVRVETPRQGRNSGGLGSGVIISPDGLVLTNSHVVNGCIADFRLDRHRGPAGMDGAACSAKTATPTSRCCAPTPCASCRRPRSATPSGCAAASW